MNYENSELIDALAAEYVLGTLKGQARERFQRLAEERASVRQAITEWELRLHKLACAEPPIAPPKSVWPALEQKLFNNSRANSPRWYDQLAFWRGLSLGSGLLAVILGFLLLAYRPPISDTGADFVLVLNDTQANPVWTLSADQAMDALLVNNLKPMPMPTNKGCMLWIQPAGSDAMYPLGRLPDDGGSVQLAVQSSIRQMLQDGKLMVTIEDIGNTTHDKPAGQVEFVGRFAPLRRI